MKRISRILGLFGSLSILAASLACTPGDKGGSTVPTRFAMLSVSGPQGARALSSARSIDEALPIGRAHIASGPPEYLVFTLKKIVLEGTFQGGGSVQSIWEDAAGVDIRVAGSGAIDLTGVADIGDLPVGDVTGVKITLATQARIKGSLDATFTDPSDMTKTVSGIVYTKAAYAYDAHTYTGGTADWHSFETTPSEETTVWFNGPDNGGAADHEFLFPVSDTLAAGDARTFTILFDISRALRFYDGLGGGTGSPADLTDAAYFYSHSVLTNSIICFFGDAGSIQGYSTLYDNGGASLAPGWMSLVFDASGDLQAGILIGDDDGSVVNKGLVQPLDLTGTVIDFSYANGLPADYYQVDTVGFVKVSALQGHADATWTKSWYRTGQATVVTESGDARFALELEL